MSVWELVRGFLATTELKNIVILCALGTTLSVFQSIDSFDVDDIRASSHDQDYDDVGINR